MITTPHGANTSSILPMRAMIDIFGERGILSPYIVGFDSKNFRVSSRQIFANKITFELSSTSMVTFPKEGLQEGMVYDCFFGAEKTPRYRFRIGTDKKVLSVSKNPIEITSDEHGTQQKSIDKRDQNPKVQFQPKMLHIAESTVDTIGKREKIISVVKGIVRKIPSRAK